MRLLLCIALTVILASAGCAAMIYDTFDDPGAKARTQADRAFIASFRQNQELRAALGLKPLDWCSECYRYDRKWALSDERCIERIRRYESGDSAALLPPGRGTKDPETVR